MSESDEKLLERLRSAVQAADPVPAQVLAAARAAFTLRQLDAELLELQRDSLREPAAAARAGAEDRILSFVSGAVTVDVEVVEIGERRDLVAHVAGAELTAASVEIDGVSTEVTPGADGLLTARGLRSGTLCLDLTTDAGQRLRTGPVQI